MKTSHSNTLDAIGKFHSNSSFSSRALGQTALGMMGSYSSGYGEKCCPPVVDPSTWIALIGGIALATFFLQMAIVNNITGRRRKRSIEDLNEENQEELVAGLESLEIVEFRNASLVENFINILTSLENEANLNDDSDDEIEQEVDVGDDKLECRKEVWQCLSGLVEKRVACFGRNSNLSEYVKKIFYKTTFHRASSSIWESLMTIPEARSSARCFSQHGDCITRQVLRQEL